MANIQNLEFMAAGAIESPVEPSLFDSDERGSSHNQVHQVPAMHKAAWAKSLAGRRVLVTGAAGFIGTHLCECLEKLGAVVLRTSRSTGVDASDSELVDRTFREFKPESVFHLASSVTGSRDAAEVLPMVRDNLLTTINVLLAAHKHGVRRVVCMGSLQEPRQNHVEFANSPYAAAKSAATTYARMFASLYGLSVTIARTFVVYGPGQRDTSKVLPYVITHLLNRRSPRLSSCQHRYDWIHVRDVVEGLIAIHESRDLDGKIVDVGSGRLTSVAEVVSSAASILQSQPLLKFGALEDRTGEPIHVANTNATLQTTGWHPRIDLLTGLMDTVKWYKKRAIKASAAAFFSSSSVVDLLGSAVPFAII